MAINGYYDVVNQIKMSNRVNAKLYKIQDIIVEDFGDSEEFISQMILEYYNKSGNLFRGVKLKEAISNSQFQSKLFVFTTDEKRPHWLSFLNSIVENEEDLNELEAKYSAFMIFIYNDRRIYAITKGYYGRHLMDEYLDNFFGLEVLSRLVDKNVTEIRKLEERGVFGAVLGAERFFREDYNLAYEDDFGKIYRAMLASIDEEYFERLGIVKKREDTTKVSISGSSSFEVSTNFDYDELIQRISRIEELLQTQGVQFNQFYRLTSGELRAIESNLNLELIKMAYNSFIAGNSVDFYHPDIFNYMKALEVRFNVAGDFVEIPLGQSIGFIDVMGRLIADDIIDSSNEKTFIESMKECYGGFTVNEQGVYNNEISLDKWIGGEIEFDNKRYFKLDNNWYKYREGFNEYLNNRINDIDFSLIEPPFSLNNWNLNTHNTEGLYNNSYRNENGFIVTDTAFLYYLEICDLIKIKNDTIYLYHVKKGLGRDLRVLENQIINASRVLSNVIGEDNNESLELYYDAISNKQYNNEELSYLDDNGVIQTLNKEDFYNFIKKSKKVFVFAYSSSSNLDIKDEVITTNSRIAKLSLLSCIKRMKQSDFDFMVERINEI